MKSVEPDKNDITKKIEIKSENEIWIITGDGKKKWVRKCPICNVEIFYTEKGNRNQAEKRKKICLKCAHDKLSILYSGTTLPQETKDKISLSLKGRPIKWKNKISEARKKYYETNPEKIPSGEKNPMFGTHRFGENNPNYGKKWNDEAKRKARETHSKKYVERGYTFNNFNPKACEYFDRLNEERKWKLQHALNGGEILVCGYFLDAYDKERNIVVEYDEPHHEKQKEKDLKRQNEIIKTLNCQFFRYDERNKILNEYKTI